MLVVEPPDLNKTRRMYCEELYQALKAKYEKCRADKDYASQKNPWHRRQPNAENPIIDCFELGLDEEAEKVIAESGIKLSPSTSWE